MFTQVKSFLSHYFKAIFCSLCNLPWKKIGIILDLRNSLTAIVVVEIIVNYSSEHVPTTGVGEAIRYWPYDGVASVDVGGMLRIFIGVRAIGTGIIACLG